MPNTGANFEEIPPVDPRVLRRQDVGHALLLVAIMACVIVLQFSFDWWGLASRKVFHIDDERKLVRETFWRRDLNESLGKQFDNVIKKENFDFDREMLDLRNRIDGKNYKTAVLLTVFYYFSWVFVFWLMYSWKKEGKREKLIQLLVALAFAHPFIRLHWDHLNSIDEEEPVKARMIFLTYVTFIICSLFWFAKYDLH